MKLDGHVDIFKVSDKDVGDRDTCDTYIHIKMFQPRSRTPDTRNENVLDHTYIVVLTEPTTKEGYICLVIC